MLGIEVLRPRVLETTSLGAAYLAGMTVGLWKGIKELKGLWREERTFKPEMDPKRREMLYKGWKAALKRAMGWAKEVSWIYD